MVGAQETQTWYSCKGNPLGDSGSAILGPSVLGGPGRAYEEKVLRDSAAHSMYTRIPTWTPLDPSSQLHPASSQHWVSKSSLSPDLTQQALVKPEDG